MNDYIYVKHVAIPEGQVRFPHYPHRRKASLSSLRIAFACLYL